MKIFHLSILAGLCCAAAAYAGSFTNDFSNPNNTAGFTLNGGTRPNGDAYPSIQDGYLALTFAEASEQGTIVLDDLDPGKIVGSFKVSFKVRIGGGTSTPADGMCFYFGSDINSSANFGEEGPTSTAGIAVSIDTYDNGGGEAPAIDVKVNGVTIAHKPQDIFFLLSDTFVPVTVELNANGTLNVTYKGTVIYTNLVLTGYVPATGGLFAVGARTGGSNENNWLDDLGITTTEQGTPTAPTIAEQPKSQTVAEYASVNFSVLANGTPPFSFLWTCDKTTLVDATNATLTVTNVSAGLNGAKFHVKVTNAQGNITSDDAVLTVNADTVAPTISSVSGSSTFDSVLVTFAEPVSITGATFALSGGLTISTKTQTSPTQVVLKTSTQTAGTTYTLTVNGVKDLANTPNTIAADTKVDFSAFIYSVGFLTFEVWNGLSTTDNVLDNTLLADPRFPNSPDFVAYASPFTSRSVYPDDTHEGYGGRMSGWLIPAESGDYRFFISSDDSSRLLLSTDASPQNATAIAEETACCNGFTEPESPRTSSPISLVAGQKYYIAALWKEGTGGDYCIVAWRKEGNTTPASQLTPIAGEYLATYANPGQATLTITQQPANASTTENKTVTFSIAANGTPAPLIYQWQRAEPGSSTFANIHGASGTSLTTPIVKKATDNGAKYRALVSVPGKTLISTEVTLTVEVDNIPPSLVRAVAGVDFRSVYLVFSEPMDAATTGNYTNYTVAGLTVTAAKMINSQEVMVVTSKQAENTSYTVTVGSKVTDTAIPANPINTAANSANFKSPIFVPGAMVYEIWTGLSTTSVVVSDLTNDPRYPFNPSLSSMVGRYESISGFGDGYGARIRGFITPKTTGDYVFFMSSDDNGELWLSPDDSAANAVLIAREPVYGNQYEWTGAGAGGGRCDTTPCLNTSTNIHLVAGQRYYTELLWKEGGGGDHAEVTWKLADAPDPANGDPSLAGEFLSTAVSSDVLPNLPVDLVSPVGSGDSTKPGFNVRVWQSNQDLGTTLLDQANAVYRAEQQLAGAVPSRSGPGAANHANVADLSSAVSGVFAIPTVINWNIEAGIGGTGVEIGEFQSTSTPSRPDAGVPGIPGLGSTTAHNRDNFAGELVTYVEFPSAGTYVMGVNSDDGFKVTATDLPPGDTKAVVVKAPSSVAGSYYAVDSSTVYGGGFKPITEGITGKLVASDPYDGCSALNNAAALKGNIALIARGVCEFSTKVKFAFDAGAIGAIIVNSRDIDSADGMWPTVLGQGAVGYVNIPAVHIAKPDGIKLKAALDAGESITVTIAPDITPAVGVWDFGRGAFSTLYAFNVPQAGLYPLRCVWFQGGGGANLEWFSSDSTGTHILLNDRTITGALKTYRARTFTPPLKPEITIARSGANIVITFTGTLQSSAKIDSTSWTDESATSPATITPGAGNKFYRARR